MRYEELHEVSDTEKVAALVASMKRDGWRGAPLVLADDGDTQLLTGSHRIAAWRAAGRRDEEVPVKSLRAIYAEAGVDWTEAYDYWMMTCSDPIDALVNMAAELPENIKQKYGIDCR